jgi:hypothetical protein
MDPHAQYDELSPAYWGAWSDYAIEHGMPTPIWELIRLGHIWMELHRACEVVHERVPHHSWLDVLVASYREATAGQPDQDPSATAEMLDRVRVLARAVDLHRDSTILE